MIISTEKAPAAIGPYSQAVGWERLLFCSGQIALTADGSGPIGETVAQEAEQVLQNLEAVLEAGGSSFAKVLKSTIYLVDMADFSAVNEVYARYFTANPPARSTVAVAALPRGARVEIDVIASR